MVGKSNDIYIIYRQVSFIVYHETDVSLYFSLPNVRWAKRWQTSDERGLITTEKQILIGKGTQNFSELQGTDVANNNDAYENKSDRTNINIKRQCYI